MPETTPRLPQSRTRKPRPEWLDALSFYKRSFDASSADALAEGAEAFAEMSPDDQAFHAAHLAFRQVQALGDVYGVLRRVEARLASLGTAVAAGTKNLPVMRKALVRVARGQNTLLGLVADGGLEAAVSGDDAEDDDAGTDDNLDGEEDVDEIEDEDHGGGDVPEAVVPDEVIPAPARREPPETT